MTRAAGWFFKALVLPACVTFQILAHFAVSDDGMGGTRLALLLLPPLILAYWIFRYANNKLLWLGLLTALGGAIYLLESQNQFGLVVMYGVPHATAYLFLLWFFGHTLVRGREPLITRLARRVHGALPQYMETYTRRVTLAWCVFFAAQVAVSVLLFLFATLNTWSLFVNLLNFPLLALMFAGEYLYRIIRYRDYPHASIPMAIQAFTKDVALTKGAKLP